jgi:hypothetical protein
MDAPITEAKVAKAGKKCRFNTDGKDEMFLPIRYTFLPYGGNKETFLKNRMKSDCTGEISVLSSKLNHPFIQQRLFAFKVFLSTSY